jgi:hypothetical protein
MKTTSTLVILLAMVSIQAVGQSFSQKNSAGSCGLFRFNHLMIAS